MSRVGGRDGENFISPEVQRNQIETWAKLRRVQIAAWHTDLDHSGAKADRPGLAEALRRAEEGETGGIAVAKLDRFARSLTAALEAIQRLDAVGAQFVSVAEGIDPTTSAGKMLQRLMLVLAEFELDRIRDNWSTAQERAVARGVHIASRAPTGYSRGEDGRLVVHPELGPAIREAFHMRARGESWRTIAAHLDSAGVTGPYDQPGHHWRTRAVQHMLRNRAYLGEARSGRHVNPDGHEPLVDRTTFEAAQSTKGTRSARSGEPAPLAGILRCVSCRYVMKPDRMTLRSGKRVRIYRCRGEHASGVCRERPAVLGTVIEPHVEAAFFAAVGDLTATATVNGSEVQAAEEALRAAEAELVAYRDNERIIGVLGQDRYLDGLRVRADSVDDTRRALAQVSAHINSAAIPERATLEALWPDLDVAERKRLVAAVIDCVFLRPGKGLSIDRRALVLLSGEAPDDLPGPGKRVGLRPFPWPQDGPADAGVAAS